LKTNAPVSVGWNLALAFRVRGPFLKQFKTGNGGVLKSIPESQTGNAVAVRCPAGATSSSGMKGESVCACLPH
jgi:hypothetical protein